MINPQSESETNKSEVVELEGVSFGDYLTQQLLSFSHAGVTESTIAKFLSLSANQTTTQKFQDDAQIITLFIVLVDEDGSDHPVLMALTEVEKVSEWFTRGKVKFLAYVQKETNLVLSRGNYSQLACGAVTDLHGSLLRFMKMEMMPVVKEERMANWSGGKEFLLNADKLLLNLTDVSYGLTGSTELYIPEEKIDDFGTVSKDVVERYETCMIQWSSQILSQIQEKEVKRENRTIVDEIEYWKKRAQGFLRLKSQLDSKKMKSVMTILKNSSYMENFLKLSHNIQKECEDSIDNLKYLSTLKRECEMLCNSPITKIMEIIPVLLVKVSLIWELSKNFKTREGVTSLLKKISNEIVMISTNNISIEDIFTADVENGIKILTESRQLCIDWEKTATTTMITFAEKFKKRQNARFSYDKNEVFGEVAAFINRCEDLLEVCDSRAQFCSPLPVFGGSKGNQITKSFNDIRSSFEKLLHKMMNLDYSILDVKASKWHDNIQVFKTEVRELEMIVGNVLSNSFQSVKSVKHAVELIEAFRHIARRESLIRVIESKERDLIDLFLNEIGKVRTLFDSHSTRPERFRIRPNYSGDAFQALSMMRRLKRHRDLIMKADFLSQDNKEEVFNKYESIKGNIDAYILKKFGIWMSALDNLSLETLLNVPVMKTNKRGFLEVNFNKLLVQTHLECFQWERMDVNIPEEVAVQVRELREGNFFVKVENMKDICRHYNEILLSLGMESRNTVNDVTKLFKVKLERLDGIINTGITKLDWSEEAAMQNFISKCQRNSEELHKKISHFVKRKKLVSEKCEEIANIMLISIDAKKSYNELTFVEEQRKHRNVVKRKIMLLNEDILNIVKDLHQMFESDTAEVEEAWWEFVQAIEKHVEESFKKSLILSLSKLSVHINGKENEIEKVNPLFIASVVLKETHGSEKEPCLNPNLEDLESLIQKTQFEMVACLKVVLCLKEKLQFVIEFEKSGEHNSNFEKQLRKRKLNSYYHKMRARDNEFKNAMIASLSGIKKIQGKVEQYLTMTWEEQFAGLWNSERDAIKKRLTKVKLPSNRYDQEYNRYQIYSRIVKQKDVSVNIDYIQLNFASLKKLIMSKSFDLMNLVLTVLHQHAKSDLDELYQMFEHNSNTLQEKPKDRNDLRKKLSLLSVCKVEIMTPDENGMTKLQKRFIPIIAYYEVLKKYEKGIDELELTQLENLQQKGVEMEKVVRVADKVLAEEKDKFKIRLEKAIHTLETDTEKMKKDLSMRGPFKAAIPVAQAKELITEFRENMAKKLTVQKDLKEGSRVFQVVMKPNKTFKEIEKDLNFLHKVWELKKQWLEQWDTWKSTVFVKIDVDEMEKGVSRYMKQVNVLGRDIQSWEVWSNLKEKLLLFKKTLPLIMDLKNSAIRPRHWEELYEVIPEKFDYASEDFDMGMIIKLGFHRFGEEISAISNGATQELNIEKELEKIKKNWGELCLTILPYREEFWKLVATEDIFEALNDDSVTLGAMKLNPFIKAFLSEANYWEKTLSNILDVLEIAIKVQTIWMYLFNIFEVDDIQKQLPNETQIFKIENRKWLKIITKMKEIGNVQGATSQKGMFKELQELNNEFENIQKQLDNYLEVKRQEFPRFYFLSDSDLLEILGNSKNPRAVQRFLQNCFEGLYNLKIDEVEVKRKKTFVARGMYSKEREYVPFVNVVQLVGAAEKWLKSCESAMRYAIRKRLKSAYGELTRLKKNRKKWIDNFAGQLLITSSQLFWTEKVEEVLAKPQKERKTELKNLYRKVWGGILKKYCAKIREKLSSLQRKKIISLLTIEVHNKDVIEEFFRNGGVCSLNDFEWKKQLRFYWKDDVVEVRQTSASIMYDYEYLGPSGRLVITPLTERCYMTLTTAIHLSRGGNPKGPAGTGKTESVKDLGKAIAKFVLVFNCSDGLDYQSLGRMFAGLCQTGAWSCFDEFNRVELEVLSVVAQQMRHIINAISEKAESFILEGSEIHLNPTCGIFVTMNPGYAGRSELPENLKALLRAIAMMVPDSALICEIQLYAQGFDNNRELARKISTLYELMKQQLSKQTHYDFGLRNIIAVLKVAGTMKREAMERAGSAKVDEESVLVAACRKVNQPKFVSEDLPLFFSLLGDLFPGVEEPKKDETMLQSSIVKTLKKMKLQPIQYSIDKAMELYNTQCTRHGVMVVGFTGSGKSTSWVVLEKAINELKKTGKFVGVKTYVINPKTMNNDELFGYYDKTREWKNGLIALTMKKACVDTSKDDKWIVFDGPVDTIWIESMNSVLDDNKVLTLISSERITLSDKVSLLFEVKDLAVASPATVSRCGMVFFDENRLGWEPLFLTWTQRLVEAQAKEGHEDPEQLREFIVDTWMGFVKQILRRKKENCREIVETDVINAVFSLCNLCDALLRDVLLDRKSTSFEEELTNYFVFAMIWSIGGSVDIKGRKELDSLFREFAPSFPSKDTVYEYYFDPKGKQWREWEDRVNKAWTPPKNVPFDSILVPTVDTTRNSFIIERLIKGGKNILVVGDTGTGKTCITQFVLSNLEERLYGDLVVNFSARTSASGLQDIIENKLEKKSFDTYGPEGGKKMIVFMDDFNMPQKDEYGSQPPLELVRQMIDYRFIYDRSTNSAKRIRDIQFIAGMGPPGGGRNFISPRTQNRFNTIAVTFPNEKQLFKIFNTLLLHRLDKLEDLKSISEKITRSTIEIYHKTISKMLPTPRKCHYVFNLRDLSKVFKGIIRADHESMDSVSQTLGLWVHECYRIFYDRLVDEDDRRWFRAQIDEQLTVFESSWKTLFKKRTEPYPFGTIINKDGYVQMNDFEKLKNQLSFELSNYNEQVGVKPMDLIFFEECVDQICRINRVINQPKGNALLIGIGGSGRSTLTKLASFLSDFSIYQIEITSNYNQKNFHESLQELFLMCGIDKKKTVFVFSDTQLVEEGFMEDINTLLNSGDVPNLFDKEGIQSIFDQCTTDALAAGYRERQVYDYFVSVVRKHLRIVLLMSPVGNDFRERIRMFPALVNCTTIIYFSKWTGSALEQCARHFLNDMNVDFLNEKSAEEEESQEKPDAKKKKKRDPGETDEKKKDKFTKESVVTILSRLMCGMHISVEEASQKMLVQLKRHNYVTPINFLEMVQGYISLLEEKITKLSQMSSKLDKGISTLLQAGKDVAKMSISLEKQKVNVQQSNDECEVLLTELMKEKNELDKKRMEIEKKREDIEEKKKIGERIESQAQSELDEALPALERAETALKKLDPKDISELKSYSQPPKNVELVLSGVMVCLKRPSTYKEAQGVMSNSRGFIQMLLDFDKDNITNRLLSRIKKVISQPNFDPVVIKKTSTAAEKLCEWVHAIHIYGEIFRDVKPKMDRLAKAQKSLKEQTQKLEIAENKLRELTLKIDKLESEHTKKMIEKQNLTELKEVTEKKLLLAQQLVEGLKDEKDRWKNSIETYRAQMKNLLGDVLFASGFLSYLGAFKNDIRDEIIKSWIQSAREEGIPLSSNFDIVDFLVEPVDMQSYVIQGLPQDSFSFQNAALTTRGKRWPLLIDPQTQGNKWIRNLEKERHIQITDPNKDDLLRTMENCVKFGTPVMLQEISEELDSSLGPVVGKNVFNKGNQVFLKLGEKLINYNEKFKLYMTTKLDNPHYPPEIATKTTLVNFSVTQKALEDQLLSVLVKMERPELEKQKNEIVTSVAEGKKRILQLEDDILRLLTTATDLLEDESVVTALNDSKRICKEVQEQLVRSEETGKKIDAIRNEYRDAARKASILYFVLCDLQRIDTMYSYSLDSYVELFQQNIEKSEKPKKRDQLKLRVQFLNEYHIMEVFTTICRGLFEKDKLLFAFQICIKLELDKNALDQDEVDFFFRGGVVLDESQQMLNPVSNWLPKSAWDNITSLDRLTKFHELANSFEEVPQQWKDWYTSPTPESTKLPSFWQTKCEYWEKMILVRCMRADRLIVMIRKFVRDRMGSDIFINPPTNDIRVIYDGSTPTTPCLFILSTGVDPVSNLRKLAKENGRKLHYLSLGQGQDIIAKIAINEGIMDGSWVFLANCHLMLSWMISLDKIIENLDPKSIHENFRLWLSSKPSKKFPMSLVQKSRKITSEPPSGIRSNMIRLFSELNNTEVNEDERLKKVMYSLIFYHSIILERAKFGTLGWNIVYDFNDSDFIISGNILRMYFGEEIINWSAVRYLIGEISYGGRVTDDNDREVLRIYTKNSFNKLIIEKNNYELSDDASNFRIPLGNTTYDQIVKSIKQIPGDDDPMAFGQHFNADISSMIQNAQTLLTKLLSINPQKVDEDSGKSPEEIVLGTASSLLKQHIPENITMDVIENMEKTALNAILYQEVCRYNQLLIVIRNSLEQLIKGIKGEVVMNKMLDEVFSYLSDGRVPPLWKQTYPSMKPLGSWIRDLKRRINMFRGWSEGTVPKVFWLSGFIFPTGFLTALKQTAARVKGISIEQLQFEFIMKAPGSYSSPPKEGAYIEGFVLEGASWDFENMMLKEPSPMELSVKMPVVHFKPVAQKKTKKSQKKIVETYKCPAYYYPVRGRHTFVLYVNLKMKQGINEEHWVKRGTALLLSDTT